MWWPERSDGGKVKEDWVRPLPYPLVEGGNEGAGSLLDTYCSHLWVVDPDSVSGWLRGRLFGTSGALGKMYAKWFLAPLHYAVISWGQFLIFSCC